MSDPKKPGDGNLDDLKSRLGLAQPGGGQSGQPGGLPVPGPPGGIAPPAFGPGASAPVAPPNLGGTSPVPPPGGVAPPGGETPSAVPPPPALGGSGVPAPAVTPPAVSPPAGVVAPPAIAPGGSGAVPAPTFGAPAAVAPPPFAAEEDDEEPEEEIVREERVVKIEADPTLDDREAGRSNIAPYVGVATAVVLMALFGYLGGAQIDRAVRANRAITAAVVIHNALVNDQELVKGLKSRVSGAARKAIDSDNPSADFQLIGHLAKVRSERPFTASVWAGEFYQAFKSRQLVFEYYRAIQAMWDDVEEFSQTYESPSTVAALKAWPAKRQEILRVNDVKGSSGYGVAFRNDGGKVLGILGIFKNSRREQVGRKAVYQSDFTPFGSSSSKTLTEYQPTFDPLSEEPEDYFIRVNPDVITGKKRQVINPGGPLIQQWQGPYRQYLADLNGLSKSIQNVQAQQEQLIQALSDIRQARRPFTFGF